MADLPFWNTKSLAEMNRTEWESLCDGCGRCCLHKIEDIDTGKLYFTSVVCHLFDDQRCSCTRYSERSTLVPDCLVLSMDNLDQINFLPDTCAYRLLNVGQDLPDWHPLVTGNPNSVHRAGISVRGRVISEAYVHPDDLVNYVEALDRGDD